MANLRFGLAFLFLAASGCRTTQQVGAPEAAAVRSQESTGPSRTVEISVTENGYEPSPITVKANEPLKLVVTRKTDATCAQQLVLDEGNINVELPLNQPVEIPFTPKQSGKIKYGCSMGKMISGVLVVE